MLKGARHCARDMVGESDAFMMVVLSARRVYTEAPIFVLPMVEERGALFRAAQRVHADELIAVLSMVEGSGAILNTVGRVPRVAQISARPMVGESGAVGGRASVKSLPGERVAYVLHTAAWFRSERRRREV